MAVLADSIDGNGIYAVRSEADKDGNRIDLTYAKLTDIPTATSDLQNDSGYITSADIPVTDVEVDGVSVVSGGVASITMPSVPVTDVTVNGTSVVSNGTAAVPVPTATSDLQNDSGFITSSDIPTQQQADWTESDTSSPAYITHKPNLAAVAVSGDYDDLSNKPTISNVPDVTSSDDAKVLKASYSGGVGSYSWETETGTTYSAGTGIDITNNTISVENPLPSSSSADEGKVLKVDANGDPEWSTGGGGTQVQSDWAETDTTDPSYIENKPTPKTLVAGQGIAISESSASLTVTNTVARDAVNLIAGTGVTLTQSGSDLTISSAGTTYTAGKGVRLVADTENNRWIVEADETVLYQNDNPSQILADTNLTLSESYMNFEKIKLELLASAGVSANAAYYVESPVLQNAITELSTLPVCSASTQMHDLNSFVFQTTATTTCTVKSYGARLNVGGSGITTTASRGVRVFKIVGVNRIASN